MAKARRLRARVLQVLGLLAVLTVATLVYLRRERQNSEQPFRFITVPVKLDDLRETVTATGTLKGVDSVDVGAQISGRIARVLVDFNDHVTAGQVLAEIDPEQLKSRVEQGGAQVRAADASQKLAQATLAQAKAAAARAEELAAKGLMSSKDLEAARADAARADASVGSAQAQATLARAGLKDAQTSLSYSTIKAPIDGIVLARLVEPGQTVAASLQSPVLFTIARDLASLQLYVDIDEADVGKVQEGQTATFSVDAWPGRSFDSKVISVHNLPTAGQTVVTYQAVLAADNSEKVLRPGMTATATIVTAEQLDVLVIPNAALRFTPPAVGSSRASGPALPFPGMGRGPWGGGQRPSREDKAALPDETHGIVYTLENGRPKRYRVELGGTDGQSTEVRGSELHDGMQVITDVEQRGPT